MKNYSSDIALENVQHKLTEVVRIFAGKVKKELEIIILAFSNFLKWQLSVAIHVLQNSIHALESFVYMCYYQLCISATGKKGL